MNEVNIYIGEKLEVKSKGYSLEYNEFATPIAQKIFNLVDACDDDKSSRVEYSYYNLESTFWHSKNCTRFVFQINAWHFDDGGANEVNSPLIVDFSPEEGKKLLQDIKNCEGGKVWCDIFGDEIDTPALLESTDCVKDDAGELHYHKDALGCNPQLALENIIGIDYSTQRIAGYTVYEFCEGAIYHPDKNLTENILLATDTFCEGGFDVRFIKVFQEGNYADVKIKKEEKFSMFGEEK